MKRIRGWRWWVLVLALLVLGYPVLAAASSGYTWRESDWNGDGRTTLGEWLYGMDVATREMRVDDQVCTEYFSLKDGLPVRVDCPSPS